jgi:hypothetical protein
MCLTVVLPISSIPKSCCQFCESCPNQQLSERARPTKCERRNVMKKIVSILMITVGCMIGTSAITNADFPTYHKVTGGA